MKTEIKTIKVSKEELNAYLSLVDPEQVNKTTQLPAHYISLFWQAFDLTWIEDGAVLVSSTIDYKRHLYRDKDYQCYIKLNRVRHVKNNIWYDQTLYIKSNSQVCATMRMTLKLNRER